MDIFYSDSLSRNLAFDCFIFMPEISNWTVFVNGKHPCVRFELFVIGGIFYNMEWSGMDWSGFVKHGVDLEMGSTKIWETIQF